MNEDCFIDSGAWSLFRLHVLKKGKKAKKHKSTVPDFSFFNVKKSAEFREYLDNYADFIKKWQKRGIRWFANVDVIGNAEMTKQTQLYFEDKHGIQPVPVVHFPIDTTYLKWYLDRKYPMIGLGGMARRPDRKLIKRDLDDAFRVICPKSNDYMPITKVHGFAMTTWELIRRWPWYSVDSTSYLLYGTYGLLCVPCWDNRKKAFRFDIPPKIVSISARGRPIDYKTNLHITNTFDKVDWSLVNPLKGIGSNETVIGTKTYFKDKDATRRKVVKWIGRDLFDNLGHGSHVHPNAFNWTMKWIEYCGAKLGKANAKGEEIERGLVTNNEDRTDLNLRYFMELEARIPKWPWALPKEIARHHSERKAMDLI